MTSINRSRKAGPKGWDKKPLQRLMDGEEAKTGFKKLDMPPPEFTRRHERIMQENKRNPGRYVPDGVRK
ncbi:hypothetical protein [Chelativorans xinjiangense]|uniref:hypothetical protein n=1 Tax=Chelativorans xinjiangense TaxID=2681485 RepID=UPI001357485D|nr:hypothetical protein [Chelativorans xinjiangense]